MGLVYYLIVYKDLTYKNIYGKEKHNKTYRV